MSIRFSVLIATYNRPGYLADLLDSWMLLDEPRGGYEIVLADDGSDESPEEIVRPYLNELPLRFLRLPHGGLSATRQSALEIARGDFVLFTDDDCRPTPGLLRRYEEALETDSGKALGGPVVNLLTHNIYSETTQAIMTYITDTWNKTRYGATFFTGSNLLFPRARLMDIGGFDRSWAGAGEDRDLCRRWCEHGLRMESVPEAVVGHAHHLTFRSFLRQHYNYGRGRWWCERRRTRPDAGPPAWSGLSFYRRLLLYPFGRFPLLKAIRMGGLTLCSQAATAAGFSVARLSHLHAGL